MDDLFLMREAELLRLAAGEFWSALADASRPATVTGSTPAPPKSPRRESKPVAREGFKDTTKVIDSSPNKPLSQPHSATSAEFDESYEATTVDVDAHDAVRNVPEMVTLRLGQAFLRHVLLRCLKQEDTEREVRVRVSPLRNNITVEDVLSVASVDDGGICRVLLHNQHWATDSNLLAILESKKAFQVIDEHGRPVVTNETLAQYFGEAVAAWHENRQFIGDDVYLIAATSTYLQFLHFRFGEDYAKYVDASDETTQKAVVNEEGADTFIRLSRSEWFNLQSSAGRQRAMCHVLSIVQWHDARQASDDEDEESDGEDEDLQGALGEDDTDEDEDDDHDDDDDDEQQGEAEWEDMDEDSSFQPGSDTSMVSLYN